MITRLFALTLLVFLICAALLFPAIARADGMLPHAVSDLFGSLVAWPRSQAEYAFLIAAWAGVFGHWWNKRRLREVTGNFLDYLMAQRTDAALSVVTAVMIWAAIMSLIATGMVATAQMAGAIAGGFAVGWLIDSVVVMRQ